MINDYEYTGKAMGTDYSIAIICDSKSVADSLAEKAAAEIHTYEQRFSRFLHESELSRLNRQGSMEVSAEFLAVIIKARELFRTTRGIFNPLVQIERFGYDRSFDDITAEPTILNDTPYDIDFETTGINVIQSRITLHEGQRLDFGGFLKGYAAEQIATRIMKTELGVSGTIINLGGDIHTKGSDMNGDTFNFYIHNPLRRDADREIKVRDCSLATSGSYKRTWNINGTTMHHILDRSGLQNPRTDIISASVVHPDGAVAESYAKVLLMLGESEARSILPLGSFSYILIDREGNVITNNI